MSDVAEEGRELNRFSLMSNDGKIALLLRVACAVVGICLMVQGHPPATGQTIAATTLKDEQQDNRFDQADGWHIEQAATNAAVQAQIKDLVAGKEENHAAIASLQGRFEGGVALMTLMTFLAAFFQLRKKT